MLLCYPDQLSPSSPGLYWVNMGIYLRHPEPAEDTQFGAAEKTNIDIFTC